MNATGGEWFVTPPHGITTNILLKPSIIDDILDALSHRCRHRCGLRRDVPIFLYNRYRLGGHRDGRPLWVLLIQIFRSLGM